MKFIKKVLIGILIFVITSGMLFPAFSYGEEEAEQTNDFEEFDDGIHTAPDYNVAVAATTDIEALRNSVYEKMVEFGYSGSKTAIKLDGSRMKFIAKYNILSEEGIFFGLFGSNWKVDTNWDGQSDFTWSESELINKYGYPDDDVKVGVNWNIGVRVDITQEAVRTYAEHSSGDEVYFMRPVLNFYFYNLNDDAEREAYESITEIEGEDKTLEELAPEDDVGAEPQEEDDSDLGGTYALGNKAVGKLGDLNKEYKRTRTGDDEKYEAQQRRKKFMTDRNNFRRYQEKYGSMGYDKVMTEMERGARLAEKGIVEEEDQRMVEAYTDSMVEERYEKEYGRYTEEEIHERAEEIRGEARRDKKPSMEGLTDKDVIRVSLREDKSGNQTMSAEDIAVSTMKARKEIGESVINSSKDKQEAFIKAQSAGDKGTERGMRAAIESNKKMNLAYGKEKGREEKIEREYRERNERRKEEREQRRGPKLELGNLKEGQDERQESRSRQRAETTEPRQSERTNTRQMAETTEPRQGERTSTRQRPEAEPRTAERTDTRQRPESEPRQSERTSTRQRPEPEPRKSERTDTKQRPEPEPRASERTNPNPSLNLDIGRIRRNAKERIKAGKIADDETTRGMQLGLMAIDMASKKKKNYQDILQA